MEETYWRNQEYNLWIGAGCPQNRIVTGLGLENIDNIPEEINHLTNLQKFRLKNTIDEDSEDSEVPFSKGPLNDLPNSLFQLKNLTLLEIKDTQLNSLSDSIGDLTSLRSLVLFSNMLTSLPDSIGNLTNLTRLNLGENMLNSLPDSIGELTNLRWLELGDNMLNSLPDSIGNLTNLMNLSAGDNNINRLPDSIGRLTNLGILYLSANNLEYLPDSIGNLTNLIELYLTNNNLSKLPDSIRNLTNLQGLHIVHNDFKYPINISQLPNLTNSIRKNIDIQNNYIRDTQKFLQTRIAVALAKARPLQAYQEALRAQGLPYDTRSIPENPDTYLDDGIRSHIMGYGYSNHSKSSNPPIYDDILAQSLINIDLEKAKEEKAKEKKEAERKAEAIEREFMESESSGVKGGKRRRRKTVRKTVKRKRRSTRKRRNKK
jgi:hypothetical protein